MVKSMKFPFFAISGQALKAKGKDSKQWEKAPTGDAGRVVVHPFSLLSF